MPPRISVVLCLCGLTCLLGACAKRTSYINTMTDFRAVGKVGVVVTSNEGSYKQQKEIANLMATQVLERGYNVVDLTAIQDLEQDPAFRRPEGLGEDAWHKFLERQVDTIVHANLQFSGDGVTMKARMMDAKSGAILWVGEGSGSIKHGLAPAAVSASGAAKGNLLAKAPSAVIGGTVAPPGGSIVSAALDPDIADEIRAIIARTCRDLPYAKFPGPAY